MSLVGPVVPKLEMWGGVECTVNRVGDRWFDQIARSGHDRRPADLDRFGALGIRALRYPILWERLAPRSLDEIDWRWSDERLGRLRALGIRPIVGLLHHGSGPAYTSLLDSEFPDKLARFAGLVARRYPWIVDYTPVNEPLTTARFSGLYGHWYPHERSDAGYVRTLLNQLRGIVLAMRAIRDVVPAARLIQTEDCGTTYGTRATRPQVIHERHRRWLTWDFLTGRVSDRHPLFNFLVASGMSRDEAMFFRDAGCSPDVLGLNYYLTSDRHLDDRLERYPATAHGGNGYIRYADLEAVRQRPRGIAGHQAHLTAVWRRYGIPVAITEAHLGCTREEQLRWLLETWRGAQRARARGVNVHAVTAWALLGSHNWDSLVTREGGHYEAGAFDVRGSSPRLTALGSVISTLAAGGPVEHPAVAGIPWWRRPLRLGEANTLRPRSSPAAPTILIVGASGTLGRAFYRICDSRGLSCRLVGREEMDIADPLGVDAVIRRIDPWAVINAAGYVRVDDAERNVEACRRANVTGPVNLAAACRRQGLRLVTFSSDLVFDGNAARPYVEGDPPRPLNVYGVTKAEAEARVPELLPDALLIRTSAFFGPWDDYNFLSCLFRALDRRTAFFAPTDSTISPTYVPDLVHTSLDLLIDGESGLWHLVNEGAISWFDFAQAAAEQSGRAIDLIVPAKTRQVWGPAVRPRYSALSTNRAQLLRPLDRALDAFLQEAPVVRAATGTFGCAAR
jgi:dTDP-4-dehydrorhamnose reductase